MIAIGASVKRIVILNPKSRNGRAGQVFARERADWERLLGPLEIHETKRAGDATDKVRDLLEKEEVDQILIAGGDGSIHEAARGYWREGEPSLICDHIPMGIINLGTGGDFHRTVTESSSDYREALVANNFSQVDIGTIQMNEGDVSRFLNISSVGMAGEMLRRLKVSRFQAGAVGYFYHTLVSLVTYEPKAVTIGMIDENGDVITRSVDLINGFVCNGCYSGGGMKWAPSAHLNDGLLRVTLITGRRKLPLVIHSKKIYSGDIESFPGAETFLVRSVRFDGQTSFSVEADGEVMDSSRVIQFKLEPSVFPLVG